MRYAGRPLASAVRVVLDSWVAAHDEIVSASFSTTTRSLLVHYRHECGSDRIHDLLQEFSLPGDAAIVPPEQNAVPPTFFKTVAYAVCKEMAQVLCGAVFPRPLRKVQATCAATRRAVGLGSTFVDGNLGRCLFDAVRMLALRVASASLPLRIALRIGFALLHNLLDSRLVPAPAGVACAPQRRLRSAGRRDSA
ncbi:MAG: hypothetical protein LIQ31_11025 [Planctomycetes bacterium]|nr:hypothetical protein [Planctomycetota bacterium]